VKVGDIQTYKILRLKNKDGSPAPARLSLPIHTLVQDGDVHVAVVFEKGLITIQRQVEPNAAPLHVPSKK
jgi:hypothetical protein